MAAPLTSSVKTFQTRSESVLLKECSCSSLALLTGALFSTICHSGTLAMATPSDVIDVAGTCTTLVVTHSILASLTPTPQFDRVIGIYMGGEAPSDILVQRWTTPTRKVYNCYGPTECTTAVSSTVCSDHSPANELC